MEEQRKSVGVVVPVYNRRRTVLPTLESVLRQSELPAELVVVDDGSTDGSADGVERWLRQRSLPFSWRVARVGHRMAAGARNVGLDLLDTPLVAFLDSDDRWPEDFLARSTRALERRDDAVAVTTDRRFVGDSHRTFASSAPLESDALRWLFENGAGISSASVFRRAVIEDQGGWPEHLETGEDLWLFAHLATHAGPWLHAPGEPVELNRSTAALYGEEGNLSSRRPSMFREWAELIETLYQSLVSGADTRRRRLLRRAVARGWLDSGQHLQSAGQYAQAARSFVRACRWQPTILPFVAERIVRGMDIGTLLGP